MGHVTLIVSWSNTVLTIDLLKLLRIKTVLTAMNIANNWINICRCREETGAVGGGGTHILGGPMLFVPFTVPSFPATHQQQTSGHGPVPAHQSHHQQLQPAAGAQNQVVQQQPPPQLNQLNHLNHQGIGQPPTSNQQTIHSTSCSPQQQATTPNKVSGG